MNIYLLFGKIIEIDDMYVSRQVVNSPNILSLHVPVFSNSELVCVALQCTLKSPHYQVGLQVIYVKFKKAKEGKPLVFNRNLLRANNLPNTVLSSIHILTHLMVKTTPGHRYYYYHVFIDK